MEIAVLPKNALKVKGKHATFVVNPYDLSTPYEAAMFFVKPASLPKGDVLIMYGPGEYEVAGVKITGIRNGEKTAYSLSVDGVEVLVGDIETLDKLQTKLKEHTVVVPYIGAQVDASFITNLSTNAILFYGEKASDVMNSFAKEETKKMSKYVVTKDKLPQEIETVLLQ